LRFEANSIEKCAFGTTSRLKFGLNSNFRVAQRQRVWWIAKPSIVLILCYHLAQSGTQQNAPDVASHPIDRSKGSPLSATPESAQKVRRVIKEYQQRVPRTINGKIAGPHSNPCSLSSRMLGLYLQQTR
jgi:hypothetical protein